MLRASVSSGQIIIDDVYEAFEPLTYSLMNVARSDERALHGMVNDIERIRFALLPENQMPAVRDVLAKAEEIFERYC